MIIKIKLLKKFLNHFLIDINLDWKYKWEGGNSFVFDCVCLLHYKFHKINSNGGGLYIDCPDCIKKYPVYKKK